MRAITNRMAAVGVLGLLPLLLALDFGAALAQDRRPLPIFVERARIADRARVADRALEADHAVTADHALTADKATESDHALTADTAASANHATTADTASQANTLSPDICQPGEILQKGEEGWHCARPATSTPLFVGVPLGRNETKFAFANTLNGVLPPTDPALARPFSEYPLPRSGVLSSLFVRSARPVAPGTFVTATLVVNGVDTALAVTTNATTPTLLSNTSDRVLVQQGDLVVFKVTESGGVCEGITCPYLTIGVLLE
jgi:hypothetical protein